jgi:hypothetical protein
MKCPAEPGTREQQRHYLKIAPAIMTAIHFDSKRLLPGDCSRYWNQVDCATRRGESINVAMSARVAAGAKAMRTDQDQNEVIAARNKRQEDRPASRDTAAVGNSAAPRPPEESEGGEIASRLNWLRAGVMGANDGIVSTAGMVVGVAGASVSDNVLLVSGIAAVVAGAMSMAAGEYVSVSSQRDSQLAELDRERRQLAADPAYGLEQLAGLIEAHGVDRSLAGKVATQLMKRDALGAHARPELGIDPDELTNPWQAGVASLMGFRRRRPDPPGGDPSFRTS